MSFLNPLITNPTGIQVSGTVSTSGTVNVSGLITVSGYAGLGPLSGFLFAGFSGAAFLSGAAGFSGAIPTVPVMWDFSGKQWVPQATAISGATVLSVWVASGNVTTAVTTNISGNVVYFSPTTQSGNNYVLEVGSNTFSPSASGAGMGSASSGGVVLASCGPLISVTLRNVSGNGPILVGGTAAGNVPAGGVSNVAAPGVGMEVFANESLTLKVNNTNLIRVFNETAGTSGQRVTIVGVGQT